MKTADEYYKEWSGDDCNLNANNPVHDSAEACDFAKQYAEYVLDAMGFEITKKQTVYNFTVPLSKDDLEEIANKLKQQI